MGNNQSQSSSDDENSPSYRYHEEILKNAERLSAERRLERNVPVYESENEEYFSAEEGDSERSITPPRTRPESSSGEDFSDDSVEEDSENTAGNGTHSNEEITAVSTSSSFLAPSPGKNVFGSKKSCGQCNVSRFQEHDSITAELETSRWHLNDSSVLHISTGNNSQNYSHSQNISQSGKRLRGQNASPFIPIRSPSDHVRVERRTSSRLQQNTSKRKPSKSPGIEEICVPPEKKGSSHPSPCKRGYGYSDSSDSEGDDVEEAAHSRSHHSRSPKRTKLSSAIKSLGSKRGLSESQDIIENDMDSSHSSLKHRRVIDKRALQTVVSDSQKRSHTKERDEKESPLKRLRGNAVILAQEEDCEMCEPKDLSPDCCDDEIDEESEEKSMIGVAQSDADDTGTGDPKHVSGEKRNFGDSFKMGANGVRNSHGKLLPVRGCSDSDQNQVNNSEKRIELESPLERRSAFSSSLALTNITENLRRGKKDSEKLLNDNQLKRKSVSSRQEISPQASPKKMRDSPALQRYSTDGNSPNYPLAKVVLTPPSLETSESSIQNASSPKTAHSSSKAKLKSAAERFKTFWTDGNLKTNFKSLFSTKRKCTDRISSEMEASPSLSRSTSSLPDKLFNSSNHICFSSSPDESSKSWTIRSKPTHQDSFNGQNIFSISKISVSPIFSSLPTKSFSNASTDRNSRMYSSILEMSANAHRTGTQQQNKCHSHLPTRSSPRLRSSSARSESLPNNSSPSSAEIEHLPRVSQLQVLRFKLANILEVSVSMGDIASEISGGIVNWTDPSLTHCVTECSRKIASKAGALMRAGCSDYLTNKGSIMEAPDVLTTPAGGRFPRSVEALLHVVTPQLQKKDKHTHSMTTRLLEVYANCFRFANERLGLQSLSLPLIGQDLFSDDVSIKTFFDALLVFITEGLMKASESSSAIPFDLTSISLVLDDAGTTDLTAELITEKLHQVAIHGIETVARSIVELCDNDKSDSDTQSDLSMQEAESPPRTASGRPRVKRPKF